MALMPRHASHHKSSYFLNFGLVYVICKIGKEENTHFNQMILQDQSQFMFMYLLISFIDARCQYELQRN